MSPIDPSDVSRPPMPLFPLAGFFLFPGTLVPLHVFEPRYRDMVEHLLDAPGRLAFSCVRFEHRGELEGSPPVHEVGGIGEIVRHRKLEDGRFIILVAGLARARLLEVPSAFSYRQVRVDWLEDGDIDVEADATLRARLMSAIEARTQGRSDIEPDAPLGRVADYLLAHLKVDENAMAEVYADLDPVRRAERALAWHDDT